MQPAFSLRDKILDNSKRQPDGCWIWTRRIQSNGYGQAWLPMCGRRGTSTVAHRVSYLAFKGQIPTGWQIDHLCRVRSCVNPEHLEAVTAKVNVNRSNARYKQEMAKTHCPRGHLYSAENMYTYPTKWGGVTRNCKSCMKQRSRTTYWLRKGVVHAT